MRLLIRIEKNLITRIIHTCRNCFFISSIFNLSIYQSDFSLKKMYMLWNRKKLNSCLNFSWHKKGAKKKLLVLRNMIDFKGVWNSIKYLRLLPSQPIKTEIRFGWYQISWVETKKVWKRKFYPMQLLEASRLIEFICKYFNRWPKTAFNFE